MAVEHGKEGSVHVLVSGTPTKVAHTTSWTVNEINEVSEARVQEEDYVLRYSGMRDWNVAVEGIAEATSGTGYLTRRLIPASTGTAPLPSATVFVRLRISGASTPVYEGSGIITDHSTTSPADGLPTFSATIAGNGALRMVRR